MHLFGFTSILFLIKLSDGNGFWANYRQSEEWSRLNIIQSVENLVKFQIFQKENKGYEISADFLLPIFTGHDSKSERKFWKRSQGVALS